MQKRGSLLRAARAAQLRGVERSAALCAVWRWKEATVPSPLIIDRFAKEFAQEGLGPETVDKLSAATFASSLQYLVALRTRLLDDRLVAWCCQERTTSIRQVVQLGVGCDTRALRLADMHFFEVDTPRVVKFRQRWVQHLGHVVQLGLDLKKPEMLHPALVDAGFDPNASTAWVCEGLLEYHDPSFTVALLKALQTIRGMAPQLLILAVLDPYWLDFLRQEHRQKPVRMAWKPSRLPPITWYQDQLLQHGWDLREVISELSERCPVPVSSLFHVLVARR
ncbi:unnamed protein product [Cladocopium goreaui]|uniref:S-adenosyl-L-methionine-dependent methyltransferase n=1 Tax=Cladocopium goreaui TaxID=2562237 RepID=A0A9P1CTT3_9DINO|nr:unnamed protein product [Cladocopium goreaui]